MNPFTNKVTLTGSHIASLKLASFAFAFFLASFFPVFVKSWRWIWQQGFTAAPRRVRARF
ncbi:hypothetical protein J7J84_08555 [bacterium]|nr:hypothetical protein [bacterium]